MSRYTSNKFTSSGSWTCPAGVTEVMVLGMGGGGGGAGTSSGTYLGNNRFGGGGLGSGLRMHFVSVIPNTTYTITIGAGGTGGAAGANDGSDGSDTTFGALATFPGSPGGDTNAYINRGPNIYQTPLQVPMNEGGQGTSRYNPNDHTTSLNGFLCGSVTGSTYGGNGGGGGRGVGADAVTGADGNDAAANTGAGGSGTWDASTPRAGGDGGSGYMEIIWLE